MWASLQGGEPADYWGKTHCHIDEKKLCECILLLFTNDKQGLIDWIKGEFPAKVDQPSATQRVRYKELDIIY